jgi:hypothetical protein
VANERAGYGKTEYMREEIIKVVIWTSGRIRNVDNRN